MSDKMDYIVGRNPVREALRSGKTIDTLYLQEGINAGEIYSLARKMGTLIKYVPKNKLDDMVRHLSEDDKLPNHQGVVARGAVVEYKQLEDIFTLAEERGQAPFIIGLDGIEDPHNLGAIIRSAEVFGAHGVVIPKRRSAGMNATAAKAASGAQEYIPVVRVSNLAATIEDIKKQGVFVAAADMDGINAGEANLKGAMMLVIGAEGSGVSRLVRERADFVVCIPVGGRVDSLNASAAAAVLMYEKKRQDGF